MKTLDKLRLLEKLANATDQSIEKFELSESIALLIDIEEIISKHKLKNEENE